jgi:hypothetical protein
MVYCRTVHERWSPSSEAPQMTQYVFDSRQVIRYCFATHADDFDFVFFVVFVPERA